MTEAHRGVWCNADAGPEHCQVLDIEEWVQLLVPVEHHDRSGAALQRRCINLRAFLRCSRQAHSPFMQTVKDSNTTCIA